MKRLFAIVGVVYLVTLGLQMRATSASSQVADGKFIFRFDTFGDEQLWTTKLRLHEAVATLYGGDGTPQSVVDAIQAAAGQ